MRSISPHVAAHRGRAGVFAVGHIVETCHHAFREHFPHDCGVDAHIEFCQPGKGPTGHLVALQIKSGPTYFRQRVAGAIRFSFDDRLRRYWRQHLMPVILVLHDPGTAKVVWKHIDEQSMVRARSRWQVDVPLDNDLDEAALAQIARIASSCASIASQSSLGASSTRIIYRLINPSSISGYPYLITDDKRTFLLGLCDTHLSLSTGVSAEEKEWLSTDYAQTALSHEIDVAAVIAAIRSHFFETELCLLAWPQAGGVFPEIALAFGRAAAYYEVGLRADAARQLTIDEPDGSERRATSAERNVFSRLSALLAPAFRFIETHILATKLALDPAMRRSGWNDKK